MVETIIDDLGPAQKEEEIARMIFGNKITVQNLEVARQMISHD